MDAVKINTKSFAPVAPLAESRPISPTLFIGLGGTGAGVLSLLRQKIYERYLDADYWPIYGFLEIDSDTETREKRGKVLPTGQTIKAEDILITGLNSSSVDTILSGLTPGGPYAHMGQWLPADRDFLRKFDLSKGASQLRSAGRMLFVNKLDAIANAIKLRIGRIGNPTAHDAARQKGAMLAPPRDNGSSIGVDVVVIGSIAGGTGAGSFLDMGFMLRYLKSSQAPAIEQIRAILALPDVFTGGEVQNTTEQRKIFGNGYAALRELEYYNDMTTGAKFDPSEWGVDYARAKPIERGPFDICYLISGSNGQPLGKAEKLLGVISDVLALSVEGTDLASNLRSCWSNAQSNAYLNEFSAQLTSTLDGRPGMAYKKRWSTNYSSFGTASATMKLPELQRIAAARLMRRLVAHEHGAGESADSPEVIKAIADTIKRLTGGDRSLLGDIRKQVAAQVMRVGERGGFATPRDVETQMDRQFNDVDSYIADVRGAGTGRQALLQERVADALRTGKEDAKAIYTELLTLGPVVARARCAELAAKLRRKSEEAEASVTEALATKKPITECKPLRQWHDLYDSGVSAWHDWLNLGPKAETIVRRGTGEWVTQQATLRLNCLNRLLLAICLRACAADIKRYGDEAAEDVQRLNNLGDLFKKFQATLSSTFEDGRNVVLTANLAASPENDVAEAALDAEIDAALDRKLGTNPGTRLADAAKRTLETFSARTQLPIGTLLDFSKIATQQTAGSETMVVEIAAQMLSNLPEQQDVFVKLQEAGRNVDADMQNVLGRARPYWPLAMDEGKKDAFIKKLAGAAESGQPNRTNAVIRDTLIHNNVQYYPSQMGNARASAGELVVVAEEHGLGLPTLQTITQMRNYYEQCVREGDVAHRHLNWRLRFTLPDLTIVNAADAQMETQTWDEALFAIILGKFTWSDDRACYQFRPEGGSPMDLGDSYESAARWLRSPEATPYQEGIRASSKAWLDRCIEAPARKASQPEAIEEARTQIERLCSVDLVLELLGRHNFPIEKTVGAEQIISPGHTMILRLRRRIPQSLQFLQNMLPEGKDATDEIRKATKHGLHQTVRFVGPAPLSSEPDQRDRVLRVLRLQKGDDASGRKVLDEAFRLDWFGPNFAIPQQITSLFQDDIEYENREENTGVY